MTGAITIDRSLVAVFDIEDWSKASSKSQAQLVELFIDNLNEWLQRLSDLMPDAYSTGDGAIVSVGRRCRLEREPVSRFMDFVIGFTGALLRTGLIIRVAVNHSDRDCVVPIKSSASIAGDYIQVGPGINVATRVLGFCDGREIMLTGSMHELLESLELTSAYPLVHNECLLAKHGLALDTFTYNAPAGGDSGFYSPASPTHPYKKYSSFPSVKSRTLQFFMDNELDQELRKVLFNAYDSVRHINDTGTFLSMNEVIEVLMQMRYDPSDSVYVLSRNERSAGFWTQKGGSSYIAYLEAHASKNGGFINQTRVLIYDEMLIPGGSSSEDEAMLEEEQFMRLFRIHRKDTLLSMPVTALRRYERLAAYLFGFTVSKKHRFAIISVPATKGLDMHKLGSLPIGEVLDLYRDYDSGDGPMKAIITADEKYVGHLIGDMEKLFGDPQTVAVTERQANRVLPRKS